MEFGLSLRKLIVAIICASLAAPFLNSAQVAAAGHAVESDSELHELGMDSNSEVGMDPAKSREHPCCPAADTSAPTEGVLEKCSDCMTALPQAFARLQEGQSPGAASHGRPAIHPLPHDPDIPVPKA